MGNICCPQEETKPKKMSIRPISHRYPPHNHKQLKQSNSNVEKQKKLLQDYPLLVRYLTQNAREESPCIFTKFYLHCRLSSDETSEYFKGTILNQNNLQTSCVIKRTNKQKLITFQRKRSITLEYLLSRYSNSQFIVNCLQSYENQEFVYLFFQLDGYEHLSAFGPVGGKQQFSGQFQKEIQENVRFVVAGVLLGLARLHQLGAVYLGGNLDNIVIMPNGYPKLTNLIKIHPSGHTKLLTNASPFSSPQQLKGQPVTPNTDFYSLGVLIHFLIRGTYVHSSNMGEFKEEGLSVQLNDLVNRLLIKDQTNRWESVEEVQSHPFFKDFNWRDYEQGNLFSPLAEVMGRMSRDASKQYRKQSTVQTVEQGSFDFTGMGSMILMDLAMIYLISEYFQEQKIEPQAEMELNDYSIEEFQMATAIDLEVDDFDGGGFD